MYLPRDEHQEREHLSILEAVPVSRERCFHVMEMTHLLQSRSFDACYNSPMVLGRRRCLSFLRHSHRRSVELHVEDSLVPCDGQRPGKQEEFNKVRPTGKIKKGLTKCATNSDSTDWKW